MSEERTETWAGSSGPTQPPVGLAGGTRVGRLAVLEQIGEGGMGRIYTAYDPLLDRRVCLKFLKSPDVDAGTERRHRLMTEARALARLSHPNILPIHDVGEFEDQVYLVTEFIDGWTLDHWVGECSPSVDEILSALLDAGAGLAAAHAQDIVHRDFKPENVMMGRDGRIRVMDFGLASRSASTDGEGRPYGTPRYMAPEQRAGQPATPATDQYAWCLTLAACLGGNVRDGDINEADITALALSEMQKRALRRGLSAEASARFEDLPALMSMMQPRRRRSGRVGLALGAAGLASIAGAVYFTSRAPDPCPLTPAPTTAWQPAQRTAIREAFVRTGLPYAANAFDHLTPVIDRYLGDWSVQRQSACAATQVSHEQSAELLDRRMICLDSHLRQVDALGRLFAQADAGIVDASMNAVLGLPGLDACADRDNLLSSSPLPDGEAARQEYEVLDAQLSAAWAERLAGRYEEAKRQFDAMADRVMAFEHLPTRARFLEHRGGTVMELTDKKPAQQDFEDAVFLAQAGGDGDLAATAAIDLAFYHSSLGSPPALVDRWFQRADLLTRQLDDPATRADWANKYGQELMFNRGESKRGLELIESAMETEKAIHGDDSLRIAPVMNMYSWALHRNDRLEEALELGRRSLDGIEQLYGPHHNAYLVAANNYASLLTTAHRTDEALALLEKAYRAGVENVGHEHKDVLFIQLAWGSALYDLERHGEALPKFQRLREAVARSMGEQHRLYGFAAAGEGACLRELGRYEEAETVMQGALDAGSETFPPILRASISYELARSLAKAGGDRVRIRQLAETALRDGSDAPAEWRSDVSAFTAEWGDPP